MSIRSLNILSDGVLGAQLFKIVSTLMIALAKLSHLQLFRYLLMSRYKVMPLSKKINDLQRLNLTQFSYFFAIVIFLFEAK